VRNASICEAGVFGASLSAALTGLLPVAEPIAGVVTKFVGNAHDKVPVQGVIAIMSE